MSLSWGYEARSLDKYNVIQGAEEYLDAHELLFKYFMRAPGDSFYRRILRNAAIKNLEDWEAVRTEIRRAFLEAIGGLPEKRTPLNAHTTGVVEQEDYLVEKVLFESLPGFHVTANLYVPRLTKGKAPGILFPIGHWLSGKCSLTNRSAAVGLAKRGFVALLYDTIGQGERYQVVDPNAKVYSDLAYDPSASLLKPFSPTIEHDMVGIQCFISGLNLARFIVWDGMRALDYLLSRPEVDGERIGCTGCSGGGTYTTYLTALDDRIKVAVPVCAVGSIAQAWTSYGGGDAEQRLMNAIPNFLDHGDLLMMGFPRPLLVIRESKDCVIMETRVAYYEARSLYERLNCGDRIKLLEVDAPHGYHREMRVAMYRWMDRWLLGVNKQVEEPEIELTDERELTCTKTGQVLTELKSRAVIDLLDEYISQVKPRSKAPRNLAELEKSKLVLRGKITKLLSPKQGGPAIETRRFGDFDVDGYHVEKMLIYTEPYIYVPTLFFRASDSCRPTVLYVNTMGKAQDAYRNGPMFSLLDKGFHLLSIDVRGTGETEPTRINEQDRAGGYNAFLQGFKTKLSYKSISLGTSIFGMWLTDVLRCIEYLQGRKEVDKNGVWLIGRHSGGMLALHAGLQDPRVSGVVASDFLSSYRNIVRNPIYQWHFSELIPGVLSQYDLDEVAAFLAPKRLLLTNVLDHMKRPVSPSEAEEAYGIARQVYDMLGMPDYFKIEEATSEKVLPKVWAAFMI